MTNTSAAPRQLALIVSVGASDIKYWRVGKDNGVKEEKLPAPRNDRPSKAEADERTTEGSPHHRVASDSAPPNFRAVHQLLVDHRDEWRFATREEAQSAASDDARRSHTSVLAQRVGLDGSLHDEKGLLLLSPAKLARIADAFWKLRSQFAINGIAVVHTYRENANTPLAKNEPIASGRLISAYLVDKFSDRTAPASLLINAIKHGDTLEGPSLDGADYPVRRDVAAWIDDGIKQFMTLLEADANEIEPVLLTTGGMASLKEVLRSITALRFRHAPRDLSTPEEDKTDPVQLILSRLDTNSPVISRHEAIDARARALYLVRRGDFPGAWAAVSQFQGSQADRWWLQPLHEVARYFGTAPSAQAPDRQTPADDDTPHKRVFDALENGRLDHEKAIDRHKAFARNVAFRLEAALQGDNDSERRFADALSALCTLIDTLVVIRAMQLLTDGNEESKHACNQLEVVSLADDTGKVVRAAGAEHFPGFRDGEIYSKRESWSDLTAANGGKTRWFDAVAALDRALRHPPKSEQKVERNLRALRNNSAHRALSAADIARIRELGEAHRLWRYQTTQPGHHALAPADPQHHWPGLVHAALCSAGIHDAAEHYRNLVNGLIDVLQSVEPAPEPPHGKAATTT